MSKDKRKKICVITNNRSDYSRLKSVLQELKNSNEVILQLVVAGSHLLPKYGMTVDSIIADGFEVTHKIYTEVAGNNPFAMAKSFALSADDFASIFFNLEPDIVVIHGDRFEAMGAASVASMMNIPIAHLQGGDITGTIDEHLRHAITKLSHLHFPTHKKAESRIISLGENKKNVFNFGCSGIDQLLSVKKLPLHTTLDIILNKTKKESFKKYLLDKKAYYLSIFHPVTTEFVSMQDQASQFYQAIAKLDLPTVVLWPNIDAGSDNIVKEIKQVEKSSDLIGVFDNFDTDEFVNILRHAKVLIGNSSSGIMEACYFGTPVVDVGNRQKNRAITQNILHTETITKNIITSVLKQAKTKFKPEKPYGTLGAGKKIAKKIIEFNPISIQKQLV